MLVVDQFSYFFIFLVSVFLMLVTGMWYLSQEAGRPEDVHLHPDATEFFTLLVGSAVVTATSIVTFPTVRKMSGIISTATSSASGVIGMPSAMAMGAIELMKLTSPGRLTAP